MNRYLLLASLAVAATGGLYFVNPPVDLQPTTPGTQQTGNINVSGSVLAGRIQATSSSATQAPISGNATSAAGFVYGGEFRSASTNGRGIFAAVTASSGATYGGDFRSASPSGRGLFGFASSTTGQNFGGDFRSDSSEGVGVFARALSTTGTAIGGSFLSYSPDGMGLRAENTSTTGKAYAGYFVNRSDDINSRTILAISNGASAYNATIEARNNSTNGYGIRCYSGDSGWGGYFKAGYVALAGYGRTYAAYGEASGSGTTYGVMGYAPNTSPGAAVYALGTLKATGTKSFQIDHPDDPENMYLQQYCAEGDTPTMIYRGSVMIDGNGNATIRLPHYFDEIVKESTTNLTPIGAAMPNLHVQAEEKNNLVEIAGGKPGGRVAWIVTGIRNDRFVQRYGAPTELNKDPENRGTYLMPELYGQPRERRQGYQYLRQHDEDAQNRTPESKRK